MMVMQECRDGNMNYDELNRSKSAILRKAIERRGEALLDAGGEQCEVILKRIAKAGLELVRRAGPCSI